MKKLIIFSLVIMALLFSCKKSDNYYTYSGGNNNINISFSSGDLVPDFNENHFQYNVTSLNTINTISLTITCNSAFKVYINDSLVIQNTKMNLKLSRISSDNKINIKVDDGVLAKTFVVNTLPDDFPNYQVYYQNPNDGDIYIAAMPFYSPLTPYLMLLDKYGNVKYYYRNHSVIPFIANFKKVTYSGKTRYQYFTEIPPSIDVATHLGTYVIMDENFNIIKSTKQIPINDLVEEKDDLHDFLLLDDNHYYILGYDHKIVTNIPDSVSHSASGSRVAAAVIQEILNDKVVWYWDSSNYPEFYASSTDFNNYSNVEGNSTKWADYMHLNSIFIDPSDGNIVASNRHQDQVIKIEKSTKKILWKLGGKTDQFGLTGTQKFSHQHNVHYLADGTLLMFDNGNSSQLTRIVEFKLNETNKTVTSFKAYTKDNQYTNAMGSVDKIDNNKYFIGWGLRQLWEPDVTEIDFTNKVISFELYFYSNNYFSYRAYKIK